MNAHDPRKKDGAQGQGEGRTEDRKAGYRSPLFGETPAQRQAFRSYLRAIQAFGEASEVLYLAERSTQAFDIAQAAQRRSFPPRDVRESAQACAEDDWKAAFFRVIKTQCAWQEASGLTEEGLARH